MDGLSKDLFERINAVLEQRNEPEPAFITSDKNSSEMSYQQEQMWVLQQEEKYSTAYNEIVSHKVLGEFNFYKFNLAFNRLIEDNESLRTIFRNINGEGKQIILKSQGYNIHLIDLTSIAKMEKHAIISDSVMNIARQPFFLDKWPLFHMLLFRLNRDTHILVYIVHHIIFDAQSEIIMFQKILENYEALSAGKKVKEKKHDITYGDYAVWQKKNAYNIYKPQLYYWKKELKDANFFTFVEHNKNVIEKGEMCRKTIVIEKSEYEKIKGIIQELHISMFSFFTFVLSVVLFVFTGKKGGCIATASSGRTLPEIHNIIGYFINTIIINAELLSNVTIEKNLLNISKKVIEALENQDIPFCLVCNELLKEKVSVRDLTNVFLSLPEVEGKLESSNLKIQGYEIAHTEAKFDLFVELKIVNKRKIEGYVEFRKSKFDERVMKNLVEIFKNTVSQFTGNKDMKLCDFINKVQGNWSLQGTDSDIISGNEDKKMREEDIKITITPSEEEKDNFNNIEEKLIQVWKKVLGSNQISVYDNLFEIGGNSLLLPKLQFKIKKDIGIEIELQDFLKYPNIESLSKMISKKKNNVNNCVSGPKYNNKIAIIGVSCRFPEANSFNEYQSNLKNGKESVSFFEDEYAKLNDTEFNFEKRNRQSDYIMAKGLINATDTFDNNFFDISQYDAYLMDPQHRLFLECSWEAMEDAGYSQSEYDYPIGVFGGSAFNTHLFELFSNIKEQEREENSVNALIANKSDFMTTRVSYKCNLRGPSFDVQTACSTSLVAIHLAYKSILNGECKMAIAGAVSASNNMKEGYLYEPSGIMSPDGHCRPFSDQTKQKTGVVNSNGIGVVVLKALNEAVKDNDHIYAIISGSAINNDGNSKVSYSAPSFDGQVSVINQALKNAGIKSEQVSYVEAHGTGTDLGDSIEIGALGECYCNNKRKSSLFVGSVKSNIGHADNAAGMAGMLKTVAMLQSGLMFPSINTKDINSELLKYNISLVQSLKEWEKEDYELRRAGVSAFGIGGTNAHIILEEFKEKKQKYIIDKGGLLVLSAKTKSAITEYAKKIKEYLKEKRDENLSDLLFTMMVGRRQFSYRGAIWLPSKKEAVDKIDDFLVSGKIHKADFSHKMAFVFGGVGEKYNEFAKQLFANNKTFRSFFMRCSNYILGITGVDISTYLYQDDINALGQNLPIIHGILFAYEYSFAKMLIASNVKPDYVIGYSFGEIVALCISGILSLENGLKLTIQRAKIIENAPNGKMAVVCVNAKDIREMKGIEIAIENSDLSCVISGNIQDVNYAIEDLKQKGIASIELDIQQPMHSSYLNTCGYELRNFSEQLEFNEGDIPIVSNVTGEFLNYTTISNNRYFENHLVNTVKFSTGIKKLLSCSTDIFVHIGAGTGLSGFINQINIKTKNRIKTISFYSEEVEIEQIQKRFYLALGELFLCGFEIKWKNLLLESSCSRISAPTYPFEKKNFNVSSENIVKPNSLRNLYYTESWKKYYLNKCRKNSYILIFGNLDNFIKKQIVAGLLDIKKKVYIYEYGNQLNAIDVETNTSKMINELEEINIIDFSFYENGNSLPQENVCNYLTFCSEVQRCISKTINIKIITNNLYEFFNKDCGIVSNAAIVGSIKVMAQEIPNVSFQIIDIDNDPIEKLDVIDSLPCNNHEMALRGKEIWEKTVTKYLPEEGNDIKEEGVYIIIGGLGQIGFLISKAYLKLGLKLVVIGRTDLFDKDKAKDRMIKFAELKKLSRNIEYYCADADDYSCMSKCFSKISLKFGRINGIVYAAGQVNNCLINNISRQIIEEQFEAKCKGIEVLEELTKDIDLEFCLILTSISAMLGGIGFFAYAAVNSYLDAFIKRHNHLYNDRWTSVLWDSSATDIETEKAFTMLAKNQNINSIICTVFPVEEKLNKWIYFNFDNENINQNIEKQGLNRTSIESDYVEADTEVEKTIRKIWEDVLCIDGIGIKDNFFELGGESLLALKILAKIRKEFQVNATIKEIIKYPTVKEFSEFLLDQFRHQ